MEQLFRCRLGVVGGVVSHDLESQASNYQRVDCKHHRLIRLFRILATIAKFLGKVVGSFLQDVAVSMNWWTLGYRDSLSLSSRKRWQGVGTLTPTCISAVG